jgi:hypothetical protein
MGNACVCNVVYIKTILSQLDGAIISAEGIHWFLLFEVILIVEDNFIIKLICKVKVASFCL